MMYQVEFDRFSERFIPLGVVRAPHAKLSDLDQGVQHRKGRPADLPLRGNRDRTGEEEPSSGD